MYSMSKITYRWVFTCPTVLCSCSSSGRLKLCLQLHLQKWEILCSRNQPSTQANIHTAHARKPLASLMDYFKRKKKCTCKAELHPFFFFNCNVILELYSPFFLPTPSLNSCFSHLPSLCGTVFRELSVSKESKRKIFLQSVWH